MNGGSGRPRTSPSAPQPLRMIDLFAGCGGITAGFIATGHYTPVAAVENDLAAAATYAVNFGEDHIHWGDIEDWVSGELPAADVVVGGPPCQGFSNLGARRSSDPRNALWHRYVDTLATVKPRAFLLENVDRFATSDQFREVIRETRGEGRLRDYRLDHHIVRATDFGAPQLRRRVIVIGTHRDLDKIEVPRTNIPAGQWKTVGDGIGDLEPHVDTTELPASTTEAFGRTIFGVYKSPDLHITRNYADISRQRFDHIPAGGNRFNLPERLKAPCWRVHHSGSGDVMGRLHWHKPSVTIRTEFFKPEKGRYLHPDENRAITHYEAARLQGFPDDFQWCGSKVQIARQIGNAVPVPLAEALAAHLWDHLG